MECLHFDWDECISGFVLVASEPHTPAGLLEQNQGSALESMLKTQTLAFPAPGPEGDCGGGVREQRF